MQWHSYALSQKKPFSNGRTSGLSVWIHKGPTLKDIRYCNQSDLETFSSGPKVGYFLYIPHICMRYTAYCVVSEKSGKIWQKPQDWKIWVHLLNGLWLPFTCLLYTSRCV